MTTVKKVKSAEMFPIIEEILAQGGTSWITVTGSSMYPFLREDMDSVELSKSSLDTIKRGDIVLIKRTTGEYILHRVLRKENNTFYMIGDAQQWIEGPLEPYQLIAVVSSIKRCRHIIKNDNKLMNIAIEFWLRIIPVRHIFIKFFRGIRKLKRIFNKIF